MEFLSKQVMHRDVSGLRLATQHSGIWTVVVMVCGVVPPDGGMFQKTEALTAIGILNPRRVQ